jgi:hypothetical protein
MVDLSVGKQRVCFRAKITGHLLDMSCVAVVAYELTNPLSYWLPYLSASAPAVPALVLHVLSRLTNACSCNLPTAPSDSAFTWGEDKLQARATRCVLQRASTAFVLTAAGQATGDQGLVRSVHEITKYSATHLLSSRLRIAKLIPCQSEIWRRQYQQYFPLSITQFPRSVCPQICRSHWHRLLLLMSRLRNYVWAFLVTISRSFNSKALERGPDQSVLIEPILAPVMDLFNHHSKPHVHVDVS